MRTTAPLLALLLAVVALAGCGSSASSSATPPASSQSSSSTPQTNSTGGAALSTTTSSTSTGSASAGKTIMVSMKGLAFIPATVHAKVGDTIMWMNNDTPQHTVTYVSGPKFASSGNVNPGKTFSIKLTQAGTIHYYCTIHPFMKASIIVSK